MNQQYQNSLHDVPCSECGNYTIADKHCQTCGKVLCPRCFEDGLGFCSDDQDETYDPSEILIPIEEDYVPSLEIIPQIDRIYS